MHLPVSSQKTSAFPPLGKGRHSTTPRAATFARDPDIGAAVIPLCSGLQICLPPRSLLPIQPKLYGSRDVFIRAPQGSLPSLASDMLAVRIGQLTVGDFHPIRFAALSAAPHTPGACLKDSPNFPSHFEAPPWRWPWRHHPTISRRLSGDEARHHLPPGNLLTQLKAAA